MWANGDQSTNAQWWPMHYGYQYPVPDANTDWATRAAAWAQQRQAQEDMAKQHQDYYATAAQNQPKPIPTKPPLPNSDGTVRGFTNNSPDPPLPPGETPTLLSKVEHGTDNLETVAMDDEPLDTSIPEQGITMTRLDYNHGQPVPLPEVGPPPAIPGMQTFDHNHGYTPAQGTQTFGHVPAQRFDYGHQSAHSASPTPPVSSHWYDYDTDRSKHSKHFDTDRPSSRHSSRSVEPLATQFDFASLSDIKKKALPLWIREGLEKMEREKQKKQEHDLKKSLNSSTSSLPTIAGYDHGNVHSPVPSPEHPVQSDEEPDKSDEEKEEDTKPPQKIKSSKRHWSPKSPSKSDSSDEEVNYKSDTEKQQELLVRMRKMLTEILLSVTNDELHNIAKESYNEALTDENKQLRSSGGLDLIKIGGALGVGDYGSDSESSEEDEEQPEQRQQPVNNRDENHLHADNDDESKRYSRSRSRSQENDKSHSNSPVHKHKQTEPGSSASSDQESEPSESSRKKKHSKHKRKDRRDSPKGRSKHKSRQSRSRSRTPKKHKSRRKDPSRSRSPSGSRSTRKSKKHSRSTSRSPSRKHRKASRSSSRSPSSRKHRRKSRSSSRSPSRRRRKRSESESPHRYHRQHSRSSSSDQHKAGKRGDKRRSRSRSRSSSPRHRRH